ncbi:MAG TPA: sigma-70 family RNA polymerase sigma factor [Gemmataceae bacterium]|nr:sigma-70 family RNA polymerase sigma factor [Gemmataceae bacterium]
MTRQPLPTLVRRALARHALADTPDRDLLRLFAANRDADAFTELVERYAPLVWGACRRVLGPGESAEDAFQATFVALARKAGSIRRPERLPGWLYGVARRVAWQHRTADTRTAAGALPDLTSHAPSPLEQVSGRELIATIEAEVDRLPEEHRSAVLLCWFQDCSLDEAARQLGTTKGRLWGWLKRARERLQRRLARRGYGVPAVLGAGIVTAAPASARLVERTVQTAVRAPADSVLGTAAATAVPFAKPLGLAAAVAAAVVGLATLLPAGAPDGPPAKDAPKAEPVPKVEEKGGGFPLPAGAIHRFGNRQLRHPEGVHTILVSPDGKLLATCGGTTIVVWDLESLQPKGVLRDIRVPGYSPDPGPGRVAFTADSKSLLAVTGVRDGIVRFARRGGEAPTVDVATVFDLETGKPRFTLKGDFDYWVTAWESAGGKEFAVAGRQAVRFYDAKDGKELKKVDRPTDSPGLTCVAPRTDLMACLQRGGVTGLTVVDARTDREVYSATVGDQPTTAAFTADGKRVAVYDMTGKVHVHDVEAKKELFAFDHPGGKQRGGPMRFSADGRILFVGGQHGMIYRWDVAENRRLPNVGQHSTWTLSSIALNPDESVLYSTGGDKLVRRWDLKTSKEIPIPEGYITQTTVVPTPDGKQLMVADHGGSVDIWDLASGKKARVLQQSSGKYGMDCVAVSDDGRWFAGGRTVQDIKLFDLAAGKEARVIPLVEKPDPKGSDHVKRVEFGLSGKVLFSGSAQTGTTAWDPATGKQLWRTPGGPLLTVDPRGRWVACGGGFDSEVTQWRLLNAATGEQFRVVDVAQEEQEPPAAGQGGFQPIYPPYLIDLRFTPDGSRLVTAHYDGTVRLWDPETGRQLAKLKDTFRGLVGLAVSPDGKWVAVGRPDGKIVIWELATEKAVLTVGPHDSQVRDVAFTPDGRGIIGNADLAPILWDLSPKDLHTGDTPDALWNDLATAEAERAYRLVWGLIRDPKAAVKLFTDKVKPAELATPRADFDKWVANLDSPQFRARESAERELTKSGARVPVGWLRKALADARSDEQRARLGRVLALRERPSADEWRLGRAVQVLERAGTYEARALLKAWALAPEGTQVAVEARGALERLARR